tara:strand:+ start:1650 stop:2672 length:1023 start_codon:yes stop_codon:yes gene_type:complete
MTNRTITDRIFGIEIEFFGVDHRVLASAIRDLGVDCQRESYNHRTQPHWKIVTDSSLSGRDAGEVVSPKLQGQEGFEQLKKVCRAMNRVGAQVNRTCGLHVHLNSTDMTVGQIVNVFDRYADAESEIDAMMPASRRNSRWCANCVKGTFQNRTTKERVANGLGRYHKVNLTNIAERGSIEFRQHSGTTEFEKIANWISILMQFVETSIALLETSSAPRRRSKRFFDGPRRVLEANGFKVHHKGFGNMWKITKEGNTVAEVPFTFFEALYPENATEKQLRSGDFDRSELKLRMRFDHMVDIDPYAELPAVQTVVDQGLMHGLDENARTWIEQRQNNFFTGI